MADVMFLTDYQKEVVSGKEVTKRGVSSEQVCVLTGLDRYSNIYMELT